MHHILCLWRYVGNRRDHDLPTCISRLLAVKCMDALLVNVWQRTLKPGIQTPELGLQGMAASWHMPLTLSTLMVPAR